MFCPKCGNQVNGNEKFCGKCGAQLPAAAPQPAQPQQEAPYAARPYNAEPSAPQQPYQPYQQPYQQAPVGAFADPKTLSTLKILYIVLAVAEIFLVIFWFTKTLYVSSMGFQETGSFHNLCADGGEVFSVFNAIFGIIAAILYVFPVLANNCQKRRRLVFGKIAAILHVLMYGLILVLMADQASYYGGFAEWGLTGSGWLAMLMLAVVLVVPYIASSKNKSLNK